MKIPGFVFVLIFSMRAMAMTHIRSNQELLQVPADIPSNALAVDLSYNKIKYLRKSTFIQYEKCTFLDLHCNYIQEIEIGYFSSFVGIEILRLDHNNLQHVKPEYFGVFHSMRTLSLGYNQITNILKGSFAGQTRMKSLFLSGNVLTIISDNMWKGLNSLEYMYIGHNRIVEIKDFAFKHVPNLKLIYLRSNFLTKLRKNMLIGLSKLEDLDLSSNEIISIDQDAFRSVRNLKSLSLAHNKLLNLEGYGSWPTNILTAVKVDNNPLLWLNFTKEDNFQKKHEREIEKLKEALAIEKQKANNLEKEMKNLKATLDKTKRECKNENDELEEFFEEGKKEIERNILRYLQEKGSEFFENLRNRFNWKRDDQERDDKNRQKIPETSSVMMTIVEMFKGSSEMVLGGMASGLAFVLVIVGPVATYLLVFISRLFNSNRWYSRKTLQTLRILSRAHVKTPQNLKKKHYKDQEIGSHSVEFRKGYLTYFGVRVFGDGGILQSKSSDILLYISKGLHAFVYGYIHTDPGPFLEKIPKGHCLVAPVVEYHYDATNDVSNRQLFFRIKVPHCVTRKDFKFIRVHHGDIHNGVAFTQLPSSSFRMDKKYITIYTKHFSQFMCTSCKRVCTGQGKAFMFGRITSRKTSEPTTDPTASLRLYICSPLHKIRDYRKLLIEEEKDQEVSRLLVDKVGIEWDASVFTPDKVVNIEVHPDRWEPRLPIKNNQEWNADSKILLLRRKISDLDDILHCHTCTASPSIVADFDFTLPEVFKNPTFSGLLKMYLPPQSFILEKHVDMDPLRKVWNSEVNKVQTILREVTKKLISTQDNLMDFGLHLGFTYEMVIQKRTNNLFSVEGAAMDLAWLWWENCIETVEWKKERLYELCKILKKQHLRAEVDEKVKLLQ